MKRGDFIKNIFTLISVPVVAGGFVTLNPFDEKKPQIFNGTDNMRFYGEVEKYRCGDIIISDMGDKACIVRIINFGEKYAEARPVIKGQYRYKKLEDVYVWGSTITETSK